MAYYSNYRICIINIITNFLFFGGFMKKLIAFILIAFILSGCNTEQSVKPEDLLHRHFVLVKANGDIIKEDNTMNIPYLEFGENFKISGRMCNQFFGQATYQDDVISSPGLVSTKMLCPNNQLNLLDNIIAQLFQDGAKVSMKENKLILASGENKLIYELKDRVN